LSFAQSRLDTSRLAKAKKRTWFALAQDTGDLYVQD